MDNVPVPVSVLFMATLQNTSPAHGFEESAMLITTLFVNHVLVGEIRNPTLDTERSSNEHHTGLRFGLYVDNAVVLVISTYLLEPSLASTNVGPDVTVLDSLVAPLNTGPDT